MGWDEASLSVLEFGAILHDIGKLVVPTNILTKESSFTPEEWEIVYQHPERGAEMLNGIDHLKPAIPFILYHHERWNGSGYPFGLKREKIPLEGAYSHLPIFMMQFPAIAHIIKDNRKR